MSINLENWFIQLFALATDIWMGHKDDKPTTTLYFRGHFSTNFSTSLMKNHFAELRNSLSFDFSAVFSLLRTWLAPKPILIHLIKMKFFYIWYLNKLKSCFTNRSTIANTKSLSVCAKIQPVVAWLQKGLRKVPCPLQCWERIHSK